MDYLNTNCGAAVTQTDAHSAESGLAKGFQYIPYRRRTDVTDRGERGIPPCAARRRRLAQQDVTAEMIVSFQDRHVVAVRVRDAARKKAPFFDAASGCDQRRDRGRPNSPAPGQPLKDNLAGRIRTGPPHLAQVGGTVPAERRSAQLPNSIFYMRDRTAAVADTGALGTTFQGARAPPRCGPRLLCLGSDDNRGNLTFPGSHPTKAPRPSAS